MKAFFKNKGLVSSGILHLSPAETYDLCRHGAIVVDVREDYMGRFKRFDIEDLIFCPRSILENTYLDFPKNKALIFADSVGLRSKEAVLFLKEKGFQNIANMAGGLVAWERACLPIKIDKSERLSGSCMCQLKKREKK